MVRTRHLRASPYVPLRTLSPSHAPDRIILAYPPRTLGSYTSPDLRSSAIHTRAEIVPQRSRTSNAICRLRYKTCHACPYAYYIVLRSIAASIRVLIYTSSPPCVLALDSYCIRDKSSPSYRSLSGAPLRTSVSYYPLYLS